MPRNNMLPLMPEGFHVERIDHDTVIYFHVFEDGGETWPSGQPRPAITVEVWPEREAFGVKREPEISWPSTSDNRPVLALAFSGALRQAVGEVGLS